MQRNSVFSNRTLGGSVDTWMPTHSSASYTNTTSPSLTNRTERIPPPTPRPLPLPTPKVQVNGLPQSIGVGRYPSVMTNGHGHAYNYNQGQNPNHPQHSLGNTLHMNVSGFPPHLSTAAGPSGPPQSAVVSDDVDMEYMNISPTERAVNGFERYDDDMGYDERAGEGGGLEGKAAEWG